MPSFVHYNFDVDDMVGMDYLTLAKKKMLKDIKTDKTIETADKYLTETTFKDTGDTTETINSFKEIDKLWNNSYKLLSEIGNRITKPKNVNDAGNDGNTNLIRDEPNISAEIIDKSDIINLNLIEMLDKLRLVINNPSNISKIPKSDVDKTYNFFKKWILKFLGDNPRRWSGVLSSQVLRLNYNGRTERYVRRLPNTNDRLKRSVGKPIGSVDVETICDKFSEMIDNWYNFRDMWRIFIRIYNAKPS